MQRKTRFSLHFRVHGKFGEAKVTKKLRAKIFRGWSCLYGGYIKRGNQSHAA